MRQPHGSFVTVLLFLLLTAVATACTAETQTPIVLPTPIIGAALSTVAPTQPALEVAPTAAPTSAETNPTVPPTTQPVLAPTATLAPPVTEPPSAIFLPDSHTVVFVASDDVLNIRSAPGADNDLVGSIPPGTSTVQLTGGTLDINGSDWVPVLHQGLQGWVNSRFLTETIPPQTYCEDPAVAELLRQFELAVSTRNNQLLGQLTHPERGLRVRTHWWNPEVRFNSAELSTLFGNPTNHDWGVEDGSGNPINGSFTDIILPKLDQDLIGATDQRCNSLPSGNTAGIITLPAEYSGINYNSYYRSAEDEIGFDWGSWAVGVEIWQGKATISYLVHYSYEI